MPMLMPLLVYIQMPVQTEVRLAATLLIHDNGKELAMYIQKEVIKIAGQG